MTNWREPNPDNSTLDEPVFEAEPLDEPVFAPVEAIPPAAAGIPPEPVFEAVPAQTHGVTLPVDVPHGQVGWETPAPTAEAEPGNPLKRLLESRYLLSGLMVLAIIVLLLVWKSQRSSVPGEPILPNRPAAGVVGSVFLDNSRAEEAATEADAAAAPESTPAPAASDSRLSAGMQVIVANTNGQGIRLRSTPGTAALTLGIYNDGAPFLVLSPGGDYGDYPVQADGYLWYRIRVVNDPADQLVGWAAGDFLVISEQ
ncbi:MAG: hypothetical protein WAU10_23800 [Caldilineaceae bacterium]